MSYPKSRKSSPRKGINIKHGAVEGGVPTAEYNSWTNMRARCNRPSHRDYYRYGGRGITVCERWNKFENFLADMGCKPSPRHTLDRKDNNLGYSPDNCRWATPIEQSNNMRVNVQWTFNGETLTVSQWARKLGWRREVLSSRVTRGWDVERILSTPPHPRKGKYDIA